MQRSNDLFPGLGSGPSPSHAKGHREPGSSDTEEKLVSSEPGSGDAETVRAGERGSGENGRAHARGKIPPSFRTITRL